MPRAGGGAERSYQFLADAVLSLHVAFVVFVVLGLLLIVLGGIRRWSWIRNSWFRAIHLVGIGVVVAQAWLGVICPLTTLEMWLRERAGEARYEGSFVQHWLQRLLFYDAPAWAFILAYTLFGLLVLVAWIRFPPGFFDKFRLTRAPRNTQ